MCYSGVCVHLCVCKRTLHPCVGVYVREIALLLCMYAIVYAFDVLNSVLSVHIHLI